MAGGVPPFEVEQPPFVPGAGPRPFQSRDDVLARIDDLLAGIDGETAPIRDALVDALTALLFQLQYRGEYAISECDILRATLNRLSTIGGEDRGIPIAPGEDQEDYRARLLSVPVLATETAVIAGVNAILAPFTATQCVLIDAALDRWFVGTGAQSWHSFVGAGPEYSDRLYNGQEVMNGGLSRPNSNPGGARAFSDQIGRHFVLLLPDFGTLTLPSPVAPSGATAFRDEIGFYVGNTSDPNSAAYVSGFSASAAIYQAIEGFVNSVIGQSVRWGLIGELAA